MLLHDKELNQALLVGQSDTEVLIVPLKRGGAGLGHSLNDRGLRLERLSIEDYKATWHPVVCEVSVAISRFKRFAGRYGASKQALKAINQLEGN
jgi:hypothetical protein